MTSSLKKIVYTDWHPIREFVHYPGYDFAMIVLNQPIKNEALFRDLWSVAKTRVAADGGANQILNLNESSSGNITGSEAQKSVPPDFKGFYTNLSAIVGDLDSVSPDTVNFFTTSTKCKVIHEPSQNSTDFTKAVRFVHSQFAKMNIVVVGGLGGRVDQGLSQLHHLYKFQISPTYADGKMFLLSEENLSFVLKPGHHRIHVREPDIDVDTSFVYMSGDPFTKYVGIIPLRDASVISTRGLRWDVKNWMTEFGYNISTSNHVLPETNVVEVETSNDVLFTIAMKQIA
ncbi:thiamine pyrophosphokinase [Xylariaceae sp. FL0662B]|nr:thiamine pyrophosphokinase [Xylariaceae sp. FL0662B]